MGCIECKKCEPVRRWFYCGKTKLTDKQLYNKTGYCSEFIPKDKDNMKIIKQGDINLQKRIKRFECKYCGCIFEADKDEYHVGAQYNQTYYDAICPTCGHHAYTSDE